MTRLDGYVDKGWGSELIWATNDKYCGKMLQFNEGAKFSMHFHAVKDESWIVLSGKFQVICINTANALTIFWPIKPRCPVTKIFTFDYLLA